MEVTIAEMAARIAALEARLANGAEAEQAQSSVEQKPGKLHPTTLRKMKEHAPPLTESERLAWQKRLAPGRRYKTQYLAQRAFGTDKRALAKARRICFWLKREGFLLYDETRREYVRPVGVT